MLVHNILQGSSEWHAYRANHFNASDAPAMMGVSPYKSRTALLDELATGIAKEIDTNTQKLFDDGHRFESLARTMAEEIAGYDLYPVTGSKEKLSASFDGITMDGSIILEHKTLNDGIRKAFTSLDLDEHLRVQMEQQLFISGATKCLFFASKWNYDGDLIESKHFWYFPDLDLRDEILSGWAQFELDLAEHKPRQLAEKPMAEAIMQLPTLSIQIRGDVTSSNLPQFKAAAEQFISNIKTDLATDQDFADAENTVKFCSETEKKIEGAKAAAIAQTASIDELMRTMDHIQSQLSSKRLMLEKLVKSQKELIKNKIISDARALYAAHISGIEDEIKPIKFVHTLPDFAGAMKSKRTLESLHNAVDSELANAKIAADATAKALRFNLNWYNANAEGFEFLFRDLQGIIYKSSDDFQLVVSTRIAQHKAEHDKRANEAARHAAEAHMALEKDRIAKENSIIFNDVEEKNTSKFQSAAALKNSNRPSDDDIIATLVLAYRVHESKIIEWLLDMDLVAASEKMSMEI